MLEFLLRVMLQKVTGAALVENTNTSWGMARGSNHEVQTQIVIARELAFGEPLGLDKVELLSAEVGKMLVAIIKKLEVPQN